LTLKEFNPFKLGIKEKIETINRAVITTYKELEEKFKGLNFSLLQTKESLNNYHQK